MQCSENHLESAAAVLSFVRNVGLSQSPCATLMQKCMFVLWEDLGSAMLKRYLLALHQIKIFVRFQRMAGPVCMVTQSSTTVTDTGAPTGWLKCFMLFVINKRKVPFLVVFSCILKGWRLEMLQDSSTADSALRDLQHRVLIGSSVCQHMVFIPRQPEYFEPTERHNWERHHSRDTQKDKFCDHSVWL